jgi:hypothetical protein
MRPEEPFVLAVARSAFLGALFYAGYQGAGWAIVGLLVLLMVGFEVLVWVTRD